MTVTGDSSRDNYREGLLEECREHLPNQPRPHILQLEGGSPRHHHLEDIGANLTDPMYKGLYHGNQKHIADLGDVLNRAWDIGLKKIFITGGSLDDSKIALDLAKTHDQLFSTVGCHPTRCLDFEASDDPEQYLHDLQSLADENKGKVIAIGECGLDYDRLQFCPKETQLQYFERQFSLAEATQLPMFLHSRNAASDFSRLMNQYRDRIRGGVVHSFTGSAEEAKELVDLGLYIGINGCSLKTEENLEAMCSVPTDRLMIETDAPWCEVRPTHVGHKYLMTSFPMRKKDRWEKDHMVKARNEPACIIHVLEILSAVRDEDISDLADAIYENTSRLFFP
ncbi:hypothetical protein CAPTEDRAFT_195947 [Capitella teleta]|uniref:Deoxyribonuclease TATDN1 n=1 Tax=Capitella teleta TaxID=283909 RepID=R7UM53_CAPTE|nr:hypothetical protein CAPTEDRAFT_195947 [Capitella teleta]|eukprot:ELU07310.1 hypothetical protein CAPTEDRAFT_195947 [Capitella teleta]